MKAKRLLLLFILIVLLCSMTVPANAFVFGEHDLWKEYMLTCVGTPSSQSFTEQEAGEISQNLEYWGSEYIHFSYGRYREDGEILMTGMASSELDSDIMYLTCDRWTNLDTYMLSNTILKFLYNMTDNGLQEYIDDACIQVDFTDGYSLVHEKTINKGCWALVNNFSIVKENITNDDFFDIIREHTKR